MYHKTCKLILKKMEFPNDLYFNCIVPRTNDRTCIRADEVWIKVAGKQKYLFASMDDQTRY